MADTRKVTRVCDGSASAFIYYDENIVNEVVEEHVAAYGKRIPNWQQLEQEAGVSGRSEIGNEQGAANEGPTAEPEVIVISSSDESESADDAEAEGDDEVLSGGSGEEGSNGESSAESSVLWFEAEENRKSLAVCHAPERGRKRNRDESSD